MSPEQTKGEEVNHRTDIWSFGVVLYEMLTGQLPFKGDYEQAIIYSILNEEPEQITGIRSGLPLELERIINMMLSKKIISTWQSREDFKEAFISFNFTIESDSDNRRALSRTPGWGCSLCSSLKAIS